MRIAVFSDNFYPELSGITDSITTLARELAGRGHHVCVFAPAYREADYRRLGLPLSEVDLGASVEVVRLAALPYPTGTSQGRVVLPTGTRWRRVRDLRPDVIHVHLPFSVGLEGLRTARMLDTPLVGTNHTPVTEFLRYSPVRGAWVARLAARYTAWYYAHCDFVSSPARGILEDMRRCGFRARHRVISNPIRLDAFRPLPDRQGLKEKFALSPLTILYAGRLAAEKRVDLVIRAVASLAAEAPRVGLALLGRGAAEAGLRSLCRSLGLDGRVRFLGYVPELETVNEIYNAADIFAIPSTAETQSIAAMQAMACGLPVVGVRAWGLAEYVDQRNGLLVEPGDGAALTGALAALLGNPDARLVLGRGGRESVRAFAAGDVAAEWEAVYQEVVDRHRDRAGRRGRPAADGAAAGAGGRAS